VVNGLPGIEQVFPGHRKRGQLESVITVAVTKKSAGGLFYEMLALLYMSMKKWHSIYKNLCGSANEIAIKICNLRSLMTSQPAHDFAGGVAPTGASCGPNQLAAPVVLLPNRRDQTILNFLTILCITGQTFAKKLLLCEESPHDDEGDRDEHQQSPPRSERERCTEEHDERP